MPAESSAERSDKTVQKRYYGFSAIFHFRRFTKASLEYFIIEKDRTPYYNYGRTFNNHNGGIYHTITYIYICIYTRSVYMLIITFSSILFRVFLPLFPFYTLNNYFGTIMGVI